MRIELPAMARYPAKMTAVRTHRRSDWIMVSVALLASAVVLIVLWQPPTGNCPAVYPRPWWCDAGDLRDYALFATLTLGVLNAVLFLTAFRTRPALRFMAVIVCIVTVVAALVLFAGLANS